MKIIIIVNTVSVLASYLQTRSWQGLEKKLGETSVVGVVEGLKGVPSHYTH